MAIRLPIFHCFVELPVECNVESARQHLSAGLAQANRDLLDAHRSGLPDFGIGVRSPIFKEFVDRTVFADDGAHVYLAHPSVAAGVDFSKGKVVFPDDE